MWSTPEPTSQGQVLNAGGAEKKRDITALMFSNPLFGEGALGEDTAQPTKIGGGGGMFEDESDEDAAVVEAPSKPTA